MVKTKYTLNSIILLFIFLSLINLVSSKLIIAPSIIDTNKTFGVDKLINLEIKNNDSFIYYNITFKDNPYIKMDRISELNPNVIANITATIITNDDINIDVNIMGFYISNVGQQNKQWDVDITSFKSTPCSLSIIKGDSIVFKNTLLSQITMFDNSNNLPLDGGVISSNQTFTKQFIDIGSFSYYFSISGFRFPETCSINILSDSGIINNPELDVKLVLKIKTIFNSTLLSLTPSKTDYNMKFFDNKDGVLNVKNIGGNIAKKVHLSGDWFEFNKNDFDLIPNDESPIIFKIRPIIINTTQTNKTHNKILTISGSNFQTQNINFSIFIEHALINEDFSNSNSSSIIDFICNIRPDLCTPQIITIFRNTGNQNNTSSVLISQDAFNTQQLSLLEQSERFSVLESYLKETIGGQVEAIRLNNVESLEKLNITSLEIKEIKSQLISNRQDYVILIFILLIIFSILILGYIIMNKWRKNRFKEFNEY